MRTRPLLFASASAVFLVFVGCREAKVASYRVKKEAAAPAPAAVANSGLPQLHWKAPPTWQEQPASGVRLASFLVTGEAGRKADMSVTQFPGDVGGDLANINRWRGQLQLPPITEAELSNAMKPVDYPAGHFQSTELVSDSAVLEGKYHARILGAWVKQSGRTWFFKLSGESDLVNAQRGAFQSFMQSVEFGSEEAAPPAPMPDVSTAATPAAPFSATAGRTVTWSAPDAWTTKPLGQMRKGSYALHGAGGAEADLSIISFPGEAGGIAENLNRWRGQIQLPPLDPTELASSAHTLANSGLRFTVVDYVGTTATGPTRLIGAVLPLEKETYFFKLMGPEPVVTQHKDTFMDFLKTVKAP